MNAIDRLRGADCDTFINCEAAAWTPEKPHCYTVLKQWLIGQLMARWTPYIMAEENRSVLTILDLGCNSGHTGWLIAQQCPLLSVHLIGVDANAEMLARAEGRHIYSELYQEDICTWDETRWSDIDVLVAIGILEAQPTRNDCERLYKLASYWVKEKGLFLGGFLHPLHQIAVHSLTPQQATELWSPYFDKIETEAIHCDWMPAEYFTAFKGIRNGYRLADIP